MLNNYNTILFKFYLFDLLFYDFKVLFKRRILHIIENINKLVQQMINLILFVLIFLTSQSNFVKLIHQIP